MIAVCAPYARIDAKHMRRGRIGPPKKMRTKSSYRCAKVAKHGCFSVAHFAFHTELDSRSMSRPKLKGVCRLAWAAI
jgi:hypothetical protein